MINLVNRYIFSYFVWWYVVEAKIILGKVVGGWLFLLNLLNVPPMLKNLFQPLYQDYTKLGRIIAFPIRFTWVVFGLLIELALLPVFLFVFVLYLLVPFAPVYGIISYLINL